MPTDLIRLGVTVAAMLAACGGCYDGKVLIDRARNHALRTRIETVDLGRYEITMPRHDGYHGMTEVQVEPFGRTARYKLSDTKDLVEENDYLLRHAIVMTVRSTDPEDFTEPDLKILRSHLLAAVQQAIGEEAIDSIGFHKIRFIRH